MTESSPLIGLVKKTESSHTTGVEHPLSGNGAFHRRFFSGSVQTDNFRCVVEPVASSPLHAGQLPAIAQLKN